MTCVLSWDNVQNALARGVSTIPPLGSSIYVSLLLLTPIVSDAQSIPETAREAGFTELVMSENFDEDHLNTRWTNGMWYEKPSDSGHIAVSDGNLKLTSYASVTTVSRDLRSGILFRHGYFEARIRLPYLPDNFGAFWLFSYQHAANLDGSHWCEIDVFENYDNSHFVGTIHNWVNFKNTKNSNSRHLVAFDPSHWNTYGLLWQPGVVTWFLNGRRLMSAPTPEVCEKQDLFLILSAQAHSKALGLPLDVDWVRVYGSSSSTIRFLGDATK